MEKICVIDNMQQDRINKAKKILFHDTPFRENDIKSIDYKSYYGSSPIFNLSKIFTIIDKFQLLRNGSDRFYVVDKDTKITYLVEDAYSNIYHWRMARIGDEVRCIVAFNSLKVI